jgi:hypothetical protein
MAVDSTALGNKSEPEPQQGHEAMQLPAVDQRAAAAGDKPLCMCKKSSGTGQGAVVQRTTAVGEMPPGGKISAAVRNF